MRLSFRVLDVYREFNDEGFVTCFDLVAFSKDKKIADIKVTAYYEEDEYQIVPEDDCNIMPEFIYKQAMNYINRKGR